MSAARATWTKVVNLADRLSERDEQVVGELRRVKLLTGSQLERLIFHAHPASSRGHVRRRVLGRLTKLGVVATLERRIGGVRAGSNGLIYCLDRFGQRVAELLDDSSSFKRTRQPYTPGQLFLAHTLAISEAYVSLVELTRMQPFRLRDFATEPDCWQADGMGNWLRPDAYVLVENDIYEASWWLEIDQGSEYLGRIREKISSYDTFATNGRTGPNGLLPRVLFATADEPRSTAISHEIARIGTTTITCETAQQADIAGHMYAQLTT